MIFLRKHLFKGDFSIYVLIGGTITYMKGLAVEENVTQCLTESTNSIKRTHLFNFIYFIDYWDTGIGKLKIVSYSTI